ncbi:DNA circularization protein [Vibrio algicola]|uniref:Multidrug DMT transporter permease n=1 Tax=Vibrio algicola TaxID=2662262 RepID=A0A5Q0TLI7_9VIBR|nr:DNA circularization N-terminal domain-containing protein [Vibrio algicola]
MAFEERLTASFRGVEFLLEGADGESGRRAIPHAYPKKESGWAEDNGKVLQSEKINGRVLGDDYVTQLQNILDALNQLGPGEFIHPWFGVRQVQIGKVSHKLLINKDRTASISFEVFEVGENLFPSAQSDTASDLQDKAEQSQDAANSAFEGYFDVDNVEGIGGMVDQFLDDLDEFTRNLPSLPSELREWTNRLIRTKDSIGNLLAYPGDLAVETMGLLEDVKSVVTDPIRALDVYTQVQNRWDGMRAELAVTGGLSSGISSSDGVASSVPFTANSEKKAAITQNSEVYKQLILNSAAISKAAALGASDFNQDTEADDNVIASLTGAERTAILTGPQLKAMGNGVASELAVFSEQAVERGDSSLWRSLRALRQSVLSDTRARAEQLPQLSVYTPNQTMPVSYVAWSQTGDTENRQSIIRRNGLSHPAFIKPSQSVEIIGENGNG